MAVSRQEMTAFNARKPTAHPSGNHVLLPWSASEPKAVEVTLAPWACEGCDEKVTHLLAELLGWHSTFSGNLFESNNYSVVTGLPTSKPFRHNASTTSICELCIFFSPARMCSHNPGTVRHDTGRWASQQAEQQAQTELLRDIFGNPFNPTTFDPAWRESTVVLLARGIYEERAFDRLPLLMDALMDAGCANEEVLEHCRGANNHYRGCWLIDGLLQKV